MLTTLVRVTSLTVAIVSCHPGIGRSQEKVAAWLDEPKPASWNSAGLSISAGWHLVGAYQGSWQILSSPDPSQPLRRGRV